MEETKNNWVQDKEVEIVGIDIEKKDETAIKRIRFKCGDFDITYKPSTPTEDYRNGMNLKGTRLITVDEIPDKVKQIGEAIQRNKSCKVKVNYGLFDTEDREGDPVTYRYIRYASQLDKWEIV